eukprot:1160108-Pelagomonas_calceolata.AAC.8
MQNHASIQVCMRYNCPNGQESSSGLPLNSLSICIREKVPLENIGRGGQVRGIWGVKTLHGSESVPHARPAGGPEAKRSKPIQTARIAKTYDV